MVALLRRARRQIDPALLAETRQLIAAQASEQQRNIRRSGQIAIDRDKNQEENPKNGPGRISPK